MAVTGTHGAGVFRPDWLEYFKDKDVVVLFDVDAEGQKAARTVVAPSKPPTPQPGPPR